jgi:hypothetical protein
MVKAPINYGNSSRFRYSRKDAQQKKARDTSVEFGGRSAVT